MICPKCKHSFDVDTRTSQQNKYLHAVIGELAQEIGEDVHTTKTILKNEFGWYKNTLGTYGVDIKVYDSTSNMTKDELSLFTNQITQFAAEYFGMNILSPQEYFSSQKTKDK